MRRVYLPQLAHEALAAVPSKKDQRSCRTVATGPACGGVPVEDVAKALNHRRGPRATAGYEAYGYDRERLYRLNNVEKHRLLITVGSMFQSLNLGAHITALMNKSINSDPTNPLFGKELPILDAFFKPADVLFPLKMGDELFSDAPDAELNPKLQFRFNVALYEPHIIKAQSILEALHQFTTLVEGVVTALTPRLK